jgi:hypothetical protein
MDTHVGQAVGHDTEHAGKGSYSALGMELTIELVIMYLVMYAMIASLDHFHFNLNNVYMTLMMGAPMAIVMLVAMRSMFPSRRANLGIAIGAALVFVASFAAVRTQAAIGNKELLRSMIPHHGGAILMCEEAAIDDPEIVSLCDQIVRGQRAEIAQMERILKRL